MDTPAGPNSRLTALGTQMIETHMSLREELDNPRDNVDDWLDGHFEGPRELWAHCMTFCSAVSRHHTDEDAGMFPALAEQFPELRPVLEQLGHDHDVVAGILRRLEELPGTVGPRPDETETRLVRGELEGLAALLESHFTYEEKRIVDALNSLDVTQSGGRSPDGSGDFRPAGSPMPSGAEGPR